MPAFLLAAPALQPQPSFTRSFLSHYVEATEGLDPGTDVELKIRLKSLVGNLVSYELDYYYNFTPSAHPGGAKLYVAVDLRHKDRRAVLTDYFPPEQIRQALLGDPLVQRALDGQKPATLDALVKALYLKGGEADGHPYGFDNDLLTRFAFHHVEGNQVAVRFGLSSNVGADRYAMTQLGIWLPIPPHMAKDFQQGQLAATLDRTSRPLKHAYTTR